MLTDNITVHIICGLFYFTDRRPHTVNPFEGQQRHHRPSPQPQRLQVHQQPQPQQPERIPQLLGEPGHQGSVGTSSNSQSAPTRQSQTAKSFSSKLYSEGQQEIKSSHQESSLAEHPAIGTRGAIPERKKVRRSPAVKKEPGKRKGGGSTNASTGTTTSTRKKPSSKVAVACHFCRGEWLCFCLM